jgi:hypothetical protein
MILLLVETMPDHSKRRDIPYRGPDKPGVYLYRFAVFWKFGENHTHIVVFDPRRIVDSFSDPTASYR